MPQPSQKKKEACLYKHAKENYGIFFKCQRNNGRKCFL